MGRSEKSRAGRSSVCRPRYCRAKDSASQPGESSPMAAPVATFMYMRWAWMLNMRVWASSRVTPVMPTKSTAATPARAKAGATAVSDSGVAGPGRASEKLGATNVEKRGATGGSNSPTRSGLPAGSGVAPEGRRHLLGGEDVVRTEVHRTGGAGLAGEGEEAADVVGVHDLPQALLALDRGHDRAGEKVPHPVVDAAADHDGGADADVIDVGG